MTSRLDCLGKSRLPRQSVNRAWGVSVGVVVHGIVVCYVELTGMSGMEFHRIPEFQNGIHVLFSTEVVPGVRVAWYCHVKSRMIFPVLVFWVVGLVGVVVEEE